MVHEINHFLSNFLLSGKGLGKYSVRTKTQFPVKSALIFLEVDAKLVYGRRQFFVHEGEYVNLYSTLNLSLTCDSLTPSSVFFQFFKSRLDVVCETWQQVLIFGAFFGRMKDLFWSSTTF